MKETKEQLDQTADNREDVAVDAAENQTEFDEPPADATVADEKDTKLEELNNRLLRLQADFDNFRRRSRQEKEELSQVVASDIVTKLLPVLDNFDRALATAPGEDAGQLLTGVEMIYRQFLQILENIGVKPLSAVGCQFDPALHEAVMRIEDSSQPDGLVVEELQKGYTNQGKVLRPCMVKVVSNS